MIPLVPLAILAGKLIKAACDRGGSAPAREQHAPSGTDFEQRMQYVAQQSDLHLAELTPRNAVFHVSHKDWTYTAVVVPSERGLAVAMLSLIVFPPGQVPEPVREVMTEVNRINTRPYPLSVFDGRKNSGVTIELILPPAELMPQKFARTLTEAAITLFCFDNMIEEHGFGKRVS
jgi:hypothetical protein